MSAATIALVTEKNAAMLSQVSAPGMREWWIQKEAEHLEETAMERAEDLQTENDELKTIIAMLKEENSQLKSSQQLSQWFFNKNLKVLEENELEIDSLKARVAELEMASASAPAAAESDDGVAQEFLQDTAERLAKMRENLESAMSACRKD